MDKQATEKFLTDATDLVRGLYNYSTDRVLNDFEAEALNDVLSRFFQTTLQEYQIAKMEGL